MLGMLGIVDHKAFLLGRHQSRSQFLLTHNQQVDAWQVPQDHIVRLDAHSTQHGLCRHGLQLHTRHLERKGRQHLLLLTPSVRHGDSTLSTNSMAVTAIGSYNIVEPAV
eukprot:scaffold77281_cov56-Attheya_sp.AAC.6